MPVAPAPSDSDVLGVHAARPPPLSSRGPAAPALLATEQQTCRTNEPAEEQKKPEKLQNNNVRNDLGGLGWPCPDWRPLPTCSRRTEDVQLAQNTAQTPDVTFLKYKTAPEHSHTLRCYCTVTVDDIRCYVTVPSSLAVWLPAVARFRWAALPSRPGWGWGDVVDRATAGDALVRRGQAGARPELRCRQTPLVTVFSSCCSGRSDSLPGKPLTGGTRAATEALAAGPHAGPGPRGQVLRAGAQLSGQTSASRSVASSQ